MCGLPIGFARRSQYAVSPPHYGQSGYNVHHFLRCDLAGAQLRYGVYQHSGNIADCFDHITGHGTYGLISTLTVSPTSLTYCSGQTATFGGRLQIQSTSNYGQLSGMTLASKTLNFDRRVKGTTTWTRLSDTALTGEGSGNNWRPFIHS